MAKQINKAPTAPTNGAVIIPMSNNALADVFAAIDDRTRSAWLLPEAGGKLGKNVIVNGGSIDARKAEFDAAMRAKYPTMEKRTYDATLSLAWKYVRLGAAQDIEKVSLHDRLWKHRDSFTRVEDYSLAASECLRGEANAGALLANPAAWLKKITDKRAEDRAARATLDGIASDVSHVDKDGAHTPLHRRIAIALHGKDGKARDLDKTLVRNLNAALDTVRDAVLAFQPAEDADPPPPAATLPKASEANTTAAPFNMQELLGGIANMMDAKIAAAIAKK